MKQEQEQLIVEQQGQNDRNHNKKIKKQLKMFWRQLMGEGASSAYTACGLCLINRQIITSVGIHKLLVVGGSRQSDPVYLHSELL